MSLLTNAKLQFCDTKCNYIVSNCKVVEVISEYCPICNGYVWKMDANGHILEYQGGLIPAIWTQKGYVVYYACRCRVGKHLKHYNPYSFGSKEDMCHHWHTRKVLQWKQGFMNNKSRISTKFSQMVENGMDNHDSSIH